MRLFRRPPPSTCFFLTRRPPPTSPLFPYTTLFRSHGARVTTTRCWQPGTRVLVTLPRNGVRFEGRVAYCQRKASRSEEHTSELQSLRHLVCRLLLEKKKNKAEWRSYAVHKR